MEECAITILEASARLKVHQKTIRREIARGRLQAFNVGRSIRIPADELERYARPAASAVGLNLAKGDFPAK